MTYSSSSGNAISCFCLVHPLGWRSARSVFRRGNYAVYGTDHGVVCFLFLSTYLGGKSRMATAREGDRKLGLPRNMEIEMYSSW